MQSYKIISGTVSKLEFVFQKPSFASLYAFEQILSHSENIADVEFL
jgi:hypothetical protein